MFGWVVRTQIWRSLATHFETAHGTTPPFDNSTSVGSACSLLMHTSLITSHRRKPFRLSKSHHNWQETCWPLVLVDTVLWIFSVSTSQETSKGDSGITFPRRTLHMENDECFVLIRKKGTSVGKCAETNQYWPNWDVCVLQMLMIVLKLTLSGDWLNSWITRVMHLPISWESMSAQSGLWGVQSKMLAKRSDFQCLSDFQCRFFVKTPRLVRLGDTRCAFRTVNDNFFCNSHILASFFVCIRLFVFVCIRLLDFSYAYEKLSLERSDLWFSLVSDLPDWPYSSCKTVWIRETGVKWKNALLTKVGLSCFEGVISFVCGTSQQMQRVCCWENNSLCRQYHGNISVFMSESLTLTKQANKKTGKSFSGDIFDFLFFLRCLPRQTTWSSMPRMVPTG